MALTPCHGPSLGRRRVWGRLAVTRPGGDATFADMRYRELMRDNPTAALKFGDVRAYASLHARAKKLDMAIECAVFGGVLYVRLKEFHGDKAAKRREAILAALRSGVAMPAPKIAVLLREKGDAAVDGQMVEAILSQLARTGEVVKQEGGAWLFRRKAIA